MLFKFMLGTDILVCPVVTPDTRERTVAFPSGSWQGENGNIYTGDSKIKMNAPLERLLWFKRVK